MPVEIDLDRWPVPEVSIVGALSDDEFTGMLRRMGNWEEQGRHGNHVLVLDVRENKKVQVKHLQKMARWLNENKEDMKTQLGTVMIVRSPFMRAAVNFVAGLAPGEQSYFLCTELDEARDKAANILGSGA